MMQKIILTTLLAFSSLYGDYHYYGPQMCYPKCYKQKANYILGIGEHELLGKSPDGIIEIEDGTQFKTISGHCRIIQYWNVYDRITFSPNPYPFGGSEFYVVNATNGEYVRANIWASPAIRNLHTFRLNEIDGNYEEIVLIGNQGMKTRWKIDSDDFNYMKYWKIGDAIVIGKDMNRFSNFFSNHEYILVNYAATEQILYVRGTPQPL